MPKIPPLESSTNAFSNFDKRHSQNNSNSSQDSNQQQAFLDILRDESIKQEEQDDTNTNSDATNQRTNEIERHREIGRSSPYSSFGAFGTSAIMAIRGYGNRSKISQQSISAQNNPRGNREESRSSSEVGTREEIDTRDNSKREEENTRATLTREEANTRSVSFGRIHQQEAKLTANELESLRKLQRKHALNAYKEASKEQLLSAIENNLKDIADNPNIHSIKEVNKLLIELKSNFPKLKYIISNIEKDFIPLKEKYLPKQKAISHKSKTKSKSNNYEIDL